MRDGGRIGSGDARGAGLAMNEARGNEAHGSEVLARGVDFSDALALEPVIVTPSRSDGISGRATDRNHMFAGHCAFLWRREKVLNRSAAGGLPLAFERMRPSAVFENSSLQDRIPRQLDRLTRTWNGVTYEIAAVSFSGNRILCDLVPLDPALH